MQYNILYSCVSHRGRIRSNNQDNFTCNGIYNRSYYRQHSENEPEGISLRGEIANMPSVCFGVFDGLGGEACGEEAACIAARTASETAWRRNPKQQLYEVCLDMNDRICCFAMDNKIGSMGTTAAMMVYASAKIYLCNIGDSKIFVFSCNRLEQLSVDHVVPTAAWRKAPLLQNLGIPSDELVIEPWISERRYKDGDVFLICSDGLTDMVEKEEIAKVLSEEDVCSAGETLLKAALEHGGKDNTTIIVTKVVRVKRKLPVCLILR